MRHYIQSNANRFSADLSKTLLNTRFQSEVDLCTELIWNFFSDPAWV